MGLGVTDGIIIGPPASGGGGSGTVTSVSATGTALVDVSVNTPTTTPQIVLTVPTAPGKSVWGNTQATTAGPSYTTDPQVLTLTANSVTAPTFTGALLGNANTATTATNLPGGTTGGDVPYQSAAGTTSLVTGNITTTLNVLTQTGNATVSAAPAWLPTTGTGNVVRAISPTLTGTVTTTAISNSATVSSLRFRPTGATAPTIAAGAGSGSALNAAVSILAGSNNTVGQITCVTGATPTAGAVIATITFNGSVSPSPMVAMLQAANANAATFMVNVFTTAPSTTTWTITSGTVPLTAALTYIWYYTVI